MWAGLYNPAADYLLPPTYTDGTPVKIEDVKVDFFPDYIFGSEMENYKLRFPAAFCPTYRYQGNLDAIASTNFTETEVDKEKIVMALRPGFHHFPCQSHLLS